MDNEIISLPVEASLNDAYKDLVDEGHELEVRKTIRGIMERFQNTNKLMPDEGHHVNFIVK